MRVVALWSYPLCALGPRLFRGVFEQIGLQLLHSWRSVYLSILGVVRCRDGAGALAKAASPPVRRLRVEFRDLAPKLTFEVFVRLFELFELAATVELRRGSWRRGGLPEGGHVVEHLRRGDFPPGVTVADYIVLRFVGIVTHSCRVYGVRALRKIVPFDDFFRLWFYSWVSVYYNGLVSLSAFLRSFLGTRLFLVWFAMILS